MHQLGEPGELICFKNLISSLQCRYFSVGSAIIPSSSRDAVTKHCLALWSRVTQHHPITWAGEPQQTLVLGTWPFGRALTDTPVATAPPPAPLLSTWIFDRTWGKKSIPIQLLKCIVLAMSQTDCSPQAGVTQGITGPTAELLSSSHCLCPGWSPLSHFPACLGRGSRCHADILPGHRALHLAAGLIFISQFSLFLLSKMRSLCTKHFISLGSSFVLVCFFNLVCRGHSLFIVEKARAKYASALGAHNSGFTKLILQPLLV